MRVLLIAFMIHRCALWVIGVVSHRVHEILVILWLKESFGI